jgi:hypothetical protein
MCHLIPLRSCESCFEVAASYNDDRAQRLQLSGLERRISLENSILNPSMPLARSQKQSQA